MKQVTIFPQSSDPIPRAHHGIISLNRQDINAQGEMPPNTEEAHLIWSDATTKQKVDISNK